MKLFAFIVIILAMVHVFNVAATCHYECDWHPEGPCKLKIIPITNLAVGPYGSYYVPRCKPCAEICRPVNGFVGGISWNA